MKYAVLAFSLAAALTAHTAKAEHCPAPDAIKEFHGTYRTPTQDGTGEWIGMASPGAGGQVTGFIEALAIEEPTANKNGIPVRFQKCTYRLKRGLVDMSYKGSAVTAILKGSAWKREEGAFLTYYMCQTEPQVCSFEVVGSNATIP